MYEIIDACLKGWQLCETQEGLRKGLLIRRVWCKFFCGKIPLTGILWRWQWCFCAQRNRLFQISRKLQDPTLFTRLGFLISAHKTWVISKLTFGYVPRLIFVATKKTIKKRMKWIFLTCQAECFNGLCFIVLSETNTWHSHFQVNRNQLELIPPKAWKLGKQRSKQIRRNLEIFQLVSSKDIYNYKLVW